MASQVAAIVGLNHHDGRFLLPAHVTRPIVERTSQMHFVTTDATCGEGAPFLLVDAGARTIALVDKTAQLLGTLTTPLRPRHGR